MQCAYCGKKTAIILACVPICIACERAQTEERRLNKGAESQKSGAESTEANKLNLKSINWPMRDAQRIDDLIARSEATQFDFLRTELAISHTLAELAVTELEIEDPWALIKPVERRRGV